MQFKRLNDDDYCMGLAFMASIKSKDAKIALFFDSNKVIHLCPNREPIVMDTDNDAFRISSETYLFSNLKINNPNGVLYLTYTPDLQSMLFVVNCLVKKVVYYETETVNNETEQLCTGANIILQKYEGNLYWLKDYIYLMQQSDIF